MQDILNDNARQRSVNKIIGSNTLNKWYYEGE